MTRTGWAIRATTVLATLAGILGAGIVLRALLVGGGLHA